MFQAGNLDRQPGGFLWRQHESGRAQNVAKGPVRVAQGSHQGRLAQMAPDRGDGRRLPLADFVQLLPQYPPVGQERLEFLLGDREAKGFHVGKPRRELGPRPFVLQAVKNAHRFRGADQYSAPAVVQRGKKLQDPVRLGGLPAQRNHGRIVAAAQARQFAQVVRIRRIGGKLGQDLFVRAGHGEPRDPAVHPVQTGNLVADRSRHGAFDQAFGENIHQKRHGHHNHGHGDQRAEQAVFHAGQRDLENAAGGQDRLVLDIDRLHRHPGMIEKGLGMVPPVIQK